MSFPLPSIVIPSLPTMILPVISAVTLHVLELESQVPILVQSPPFTPSVTVNVPDAVVGPGGVVSTGESSTVIVKLAVPSFPEVSVAEQFTIVFPTGHG
jgi:hypothetical protein